MQQSQQPSGASAGTMATQVANPTPAPTGPSEPTAPSANDQQQQQQQQTIPATTMAQTNLDPAFLGRLKYQVEFYFSPQNLARDTYLRSLMAQYGGSSVPLAVIASFPKVRELCSTAIPPNPILHMNKALEGSSVAKISHDGYWIGPLLPPPPYDPVNMKQRHHSLTMMNTGTGTMNTFNPLPHIRQQSSGSGNAAPRTASPLSTSSNDRSSTTSTTVLVSDIPTDIAIEVVITAFTTEKVIPKSANPVMIDSSNNSNSKSKSNAWYVIFASEKDASNAISAAKKEGKTINGHPIRAKIINDPHLQQQQHQNQLPPGKNSNKTSPTTTTASQDALGETDSTKSQNSHRHSAGGGGSGGGQIPIQQQNYPTHMAPPQGMPNNAGMYPYPYGFQPHLQYPGGRYPPPAPHLPHPMQYPPQMYGHGGPPYHHPQYMPRGQFYGGNGAGGGGGPTQPMFMRSVTDPGQMRPNQMMKGKNNNDGSTGGGGNMNKNSQMRKNNRKKIPQQQQQYQQQQNYFQGYPDAAAAAFGGVGLGIEQLGHRPKRGSSQSLHSEGGVHDYNFRKAMGRNNGQGASGAGGAGRKYPLTMDHVEHSYDARMSSHMMKGKKKKSKRRTSSEAESERREQQQKTEIFDENMFPALSPSKSKAAASNTTTTSEAATNVPPNNGFSGYADALRQKSKPKSEDTTTSSSPTTTTTNDKKELELDTTEDINQMVETMKISQNTNDNTDKIASHEEVSTDAAKPANTGSDGTTNLTKETPEDLSTQHETVDVSNETKKPLLDENEPTPKEASVTASTSATTTKVSKDASAASNPISNNDSTTTDNNKNEPATENKLGSESETNSSGGGAWGAKRSFIDVVKQS